MVLYANNILCIILTQYYFFKQLFKGNMYPNQTDIIEDFAIKSGEKLEKAVSGVFLTMEHIAIGISILVLCIILLICFCYGIKILELFKTLFRRKTQNASGQETFEKHPSNGNLFFF